MDVIERTGELRGIESSYILSQSTINTNFLLLVSGRAMSGLATAAFSFALSLYILDITGSSAAFSLVLGSAILPGIFVNMLAGVFIDHHNKKHIMVVSDILSGIVVLLFLAIFSLAPENIFIFVGYSIILSTVQAFFNLAINASIPNFVSKDYVPRVNSAIQATAAASNVIGPVLGALVYKAIGLKALFIINGITFILSGVFEMFLVYKKESHAKDTSGKRSYIEDFKYLFMYLKSNKILAFFFTFAVFINLMYNPLIFIVLRFINYKIIEVSELQLSFIQASAAVGMIIGAFFISFKKSLNNTLIKKFMKLFRIQAVLIICWIFPKLPIFTEDMKWVITLIFCLFLTAYGILNTFQNIPVISYFQVQVPENLRGRLFGILFSAMFISTPVGMWLYGIVLEVFDWGYVIAVSGILMLLASIFASRNKAFKDFISKEDFE